MDKEGSDQDFKNQTKNQAKNNIFGRTARACLYLLIFLLPLFFLPFTANVLDFNKQILLVGLTFFALFCWLLQSLIDERISLNVGRLNLAVVFFLVVLILSTIFSVWRYGSFWGWPLPVASSFLSLFCLILVYFLISNLFSQKKILRLVELLIATGFLVALFSFPQLLGRFFLPFDFSKDTSFNPIGTVNALGIFLACLLPLATVLPFVSQKLVVRVVACLFALLSIFILLLINSRIAWLIVLLGASVSLVLEIIRREAFSTKRLFLPILLLVISLLALIFGAPIISFSDLPTEISLSIKSTLDIAIKTLKDTSLSFGSGLSTFVYGYSKFRPVEINQTAFWDARFASGSSEILNLLATTGILGFLSFLATIIMIIFLGLRHLVVIWETQKERYPWSLAAGIFSSLFSVVLSFLLYPANLSSLFLFWILVASILLLAEEKIKEIDLPSLSSVGTKKSVKKPIIPWPTTIVSFLFIFVLISGLAIFSLLCQRYLAEVNYLLANRAIQQNQIPEAITRFSSAIKLTGENQDNYWRDLSQAYVLQINEELQKQESGQGKLSQPLTDKINQAIFASRRATEVAPQNVTNWTIRGVIYSSLFGLVEGTDDWAIKCFEEAIRLEPANPYIWTRLGQVYLIKADNLIGIEEKTNERQGFLNAAREKFQKAADLKPDYAPARFQLAMIDIRENKTKEAISKLELTKMIAPLDSGLAFQLGLIYRADSQLELAKAEFERAVILDPNYSNARYFLGLVYDSQGDKNKAIAQFEKIEELNPANEEVKKILTNLREGKPALEGIQSNEPPLEEKPPEELER